MLGFKGIETIRANTWTSFARPVYLDLTHLRRSRTRRHFRDLNDGAWFLVAPTKCLSTWYASSTVLPLKMRSRSRLVALRNESAKYIGPIFGPISLARTCGRGRILLLPASIKTGIVYVTGARHARNVAPRIEPSLGGHRHSNGRRSSHPDGLPQSRPHPASHRRRCEGGTVAGRHGPA